MLAGIAAIGASIVLFIKSLFKKDKKDKNMGGR